MWASARTNAEFTQSADLQRDKVQVVKAFFDVMQLHPAQMSPMDIKTWTKSLTRLSRGQSL